MPDFIRQGASVTAGVLEAAAGQLRKLTDADEQDETTAVATTPPPATTTRATARATEARAKSRPAAGTRSRIANPKAAKKVRAREG